MKAHPSISKTAKEAAPNEEKQKYAKNKMRKQANVMSSQSFQSQPSKRQKEPFMAIQR
jgi:hypothetical protein